MWVGVGLCLVSVNRHLGLGRKRVKIITNPNISFTETLTPAARTDSIHFLLKFTAAQDLKIHQVDVKLAFLNRKLKETIYMSQLKGCIAKGKEDWAWQLNQALYGLCQSGYIWYQKLQDTLLKLGFKSGTTDLCIFIWSKTRGQI